ncbi:guanitoxin biosynthesis MATE family efflux transporter GntT [Gloeocapsopsis dulcis]|nr:guanitoxin biosynthesis MATE family efflux transporter GntT [Gloeocapsopsis dulcis]WNN88062.1 guanitoxin biosynthesis MATE family efflux transporter GntT [Gloeocapsopsis dulcis]
MSQQYNFLHRFLRLASINIISNLMVPLAGLIDVAFLGHLAEIRHLAGVALATVLFNYIYWTFGFLRMATTGTTAQAVGRSDREAVILIGLRNSLLALTLGLTILLLQHPLRELGFALLSATPEVKAAGRDYYNTLIWGAPATLINFVFVGWFLGREQSSKVLLLSAVANGANILLDYILINLWGLESAGAGIATATSQYLMLLVGGVLVYLEHQLRTIPIKLQQIFDWRALKAAFALNGDILIRTLALVSTFAFFTNLSSVLGTEVLATNTLLMQVVTLAAYFIDGLAFATESLAGIFRGQGSSKLLLPLLWVSGGTSLVIGLLFAILFVGFPRFLFGLLTHHLAVIEQVDNYVLWLLPILSIGSQAYMLDGYFLGLTEGHILRNASVLAAIAGIAFMLVVAYLFPSNHLLWLALSCFMAARVVTLAIQLPASYKDLKRVLSSEC